MIRIRLKYVVSIDDIVLYLWIGYCLINVFSHMINQLFLGGLINMLLIWFFMFYFIFMYGNSEKSRYSRYPKKFIISFLLFSFIFIIMQQFLYNDSSIYQSFGIDFSSSVWNLFSFIPMVISAVSIICKSDIQKRITLRNAVFLFSFITFLCSCFILRNNYSAAKITATGNSEYIPFFFGFSIVSAFSVIVPFLFYYLSKTKNKLIFVLYMSVVFWGILSASFFIAILTALLGGLLYFVFSIENKRVRILLMIVVVSGTIIATISGVFENAIMYFVKIIPFEEISKRLSQLVLFFDKGIINDTTSRLELYFESFSAIIKHPLFGNIIWDSDCFISGHSTIMDIWNGCGVFPLILIVYSLYSIMRININFCKNEKQKAALFSSTVALGFTALFNPIFASSFIVVLWTVAPMVFDRLEIQNEHS